jgi:deoxyhypusine synthase
MAKKACDDPRHPPKVVEKLGHKTQNRKKLHPRAIRGHAYERNVPIFAPTARDTAILSMFAMPEQSENRHS